MAALAFIAAGGALSVVAGRRRAVDVGSGRRMHLICEGPPGNGSTIVFEAGAFGLSADWGAVQQMATLRGWRSCAYDRAGMGASDPSPEPRDAIRITADFEHLLKTAAENGP